MFSTGTLLGKSNATTLVSGRCAGALILTAPAVFGQDTRQVPADSMVYDLKNPDPVRRKEAAAALGKNKIQRATPDLVAAVGDSDASVRRAIVIALQQMQDPRALPGFVTLSSDAEKDIRDRVDRGHDDCMYLPRESGLVVTLNKVATLFNPWSDEWGTSSSSPTCTWSRPSPTRSGSGCVRMRTGDSGQRPRVHSGSCAQRMPVSDLATALRGDKVNNVRFESARALRKIGDPSVGPQLVELISYGDAKVRNEVVLHDRTASVRRGGATALRAVRQGTGRDRTQRRPRVPGAADRRARVHRRSLVERSLRAREVECRSGACAPCLRGPRTRSRIRRRWTTISTDRLRTKDAKILDAQAWALYRMGRKEFLTAVVDGLGDRRTNKESREYLLELTHDQVPDLFPFATHKDVNVREGLAEILGLIGDDRAVPALQELSRDKSGEVADLASQALHRIGARKSA